MTDTKLINYYEKFWQCNSCKGYVKLTIKNETVIAKIAAIKQLTNNKFDRIITLEPTDILGKKIVNHTFKLSELKSCEEIRIVEATI